MRWLETTLAVLLLAGPAGAQTDGTLKWTGLNPGYATGGTVVSSPAIGSDGTIYVGSESRRLFAINPNKTTKWLYPPANVILPPTDWFDASPALADDGTIYVGNFDGNLYALNPNGTAKWQAPFSTGAYVFSSPAIGADGTVYFGAGDGALYALNPDKTVRWRYQTADWVDSSPAIGPDGTICFGSWDDRVYAVRPDGSLKWSVTTGGAIQSSPAIGADGTVYIGSADSSLWAIRPDGTVAWTFPTGDSVDAHPVVAQDGTIYFGSADGKFYAVKPDGTPAWAAPYNVGQGVFGGAVLRADGTIIFGASDRRVHALNANGTVKWTYTTGDIIDSTPTIGPDGTIYFGSYDNRVYALHGNGFGIMDAPWPKFRRDARNQGRAPAAAPVVPPSITVPPASQTVDYGTTASFSVTAGGTQPLGFQWTKNGVDIAGATASSHTIASAAVADAGNYAVRVANAAGTVTSPAAVLVVNPPVAPVITLAPRPLVVTPGARLSLWVAASGSEPFSYQWRKDGSPVPGATGAFFEVGAADGADAGSYTVEVTNAGGTVASAAAAVAVTPGASSRLINLSSRGFVGTGESILIPGFAVAGSQPRRLLVRAVGPTLGGFGVSGTIADPRLTVFSGGTGLFSNDDWSLAANAADIAAAAALIGAFPLPAGSKDAAALVDLAPGGYTVQVSGVGDLTGVSLVEVYDVSMDGGSAGRLVNLSTRADAGTDDNILIPGIVIEGTAARTLLIRAVGPTLSLFGVADFLANPVLRLFDGSQEILANSTWTAAPDPAALAAATSAVGAFALEADSADAAVLVVLMPGIYTAQAASADGTAGNVLVEAYEVP